MFHSLALSIRKGNNISPLCVFCIIFFAFFRIYLKIPWCIKMFQESLCIMYINMTVLWYTTKFKTEIFYFSKWSPSHSIYSEYSYSNFLISFFSSTKAVLTASSTSNLVLWVCSLNFGNSEYHWGLTSMSKNSDRWAGALAWRNNTPNDNFPRRFPLIISRTFGIKSSK